ncbi:glycosylation-dependent cell adhesion molecule 1-like [Microtus pennsylvanicus]|uniref:glycosylation-dependent cell adhesion molecule 1-like n=1 Tax=Microtus pennsylvanicus TaxID=10058 RepID=UPI003F6AFDB2
MNFFTILLFASLATTSLAVLPGSEDELHVKTQHTTAGKSLFPVHSSHISKENTSSNDSSKEPSIFREESVSRDNVLIECTKPKSQKAQVRLRSGASQLEETIGPITSTESRIPGCPPADGLRQRPDQVWLSSLRGRDLSSRQRSHDGVKAQDLGRRRPGGAMRNQSAAAQSPGRVGRAEPGAASRA